MSDIYDRIYDRLAEFKKEAEADYNQAVAEAKRKDAEKRQK